MAATSAKNAWTVGVRYTPAESELTRIEHWNGNAWKVQRSPNAGNGQLFDLLYGVAATSAKNAWAVGSHANSNGDSLTLIERWNRNG